MSTTVETKMVEYSTATGILRQIVESFLLSENPDPKVSACVLVKVAEEQLYLPESVIELKEKVKQKYNL